MIRKDADVPKKIWDDPFKEDRGEVLRAWGIFVAVIGLAAIALGALIVWSIVEVTK